MWDASSHLLDAHCLSPGAPWRSGDAFRPSFHIHSCWAFIGFILYAAIFFPFTFILIFWFSEFREVFIIVNTDCWEVLKGCDLYVLGSLMTPRKFIICWFTTWQPTYDSHSSFSRGKRSYFLVYFSPSFVTESWSCFDFISCVTDTVSCRKVYEVLWKTELNFGQHSLVGIATSYWLDGPGIESQWRRYFPHPSIPALEPT